MDSVDPIEHSPAAVVVSFRRSLNSFASEARLGASLRSAPDITVKQLEAASLLANLLSSCPHSENLFSAKRRVSLKQSRF